MGLVVGQAHEAKSKAKLAFWVPAEPHPLMGFRV